MSEHFRQNNESQRDLENVKEYQQDWQHIEIPHAKLEQAIFNGMKQGKRRTKLVPLKWSALAASLLLVVLLSSIRLSPTVAAYIGQWPGMHPIVSLIAQEKGLQDAINHEWIQVIDQSAEHAGIKMTVDEIMLDETRLLLFYSLENQSEWHHPRVSRAEISDGHGNRLDYNVVSWSATETLNENPEVLSGKLEFLFREGFEIPERMTFTANMDAYEDEQVKPRDINDDHPADHVDTGNGNEAHMIEGPWSVTFDIDQEKFKALKKVYPVDKIVTIEGQRIHFKQLLVYPTRSVLKVGFPEENSKKIFDIEDLRLEDEYGETFKRVTGSSSRGKGDDHSFYFESNFFNETRDLHIHFSTLRALEKDKLKVELDLDHEEFTVKPDEQLQFEALERTRQGGYRLKYQVIADPDHAHDQIRQYSVLSSTFKDANGNEYSSRSGGSTSSEKENETHISEAFMDLPDEKYASPLIFEIYDYPERLVQSTELEIQMK